MSRAARYLHALEQISGELRDVADDMETFMEQLRMQRVTGVPVAELRAKYHEYVHRSATADVIHRLNKLTTTMRRDEQLEEDHQLEPDMVNANQHALRLCSSMLAVSKLLTGAE